LQCFKNIPEEAVTHVRKLADEAEIFLTHTFPLHLSKESECAAHCINFALSDKKEPSAMRPCTHKHDKFCSDCDQPFLMFEELKDLVEIGSDSVV